MLTCIKCKKELPEGAVYCLYCGKKQVSAAKRKRHAKRPAGTGSIVKLKGAREKAYCARLPAQYQDGKAVRVIVGCYATYAEAEQALQEANKLPPLTGNYTLEDVFELFKKGNYFAALSPSGQDSHEKAWKYLDAWKNTKAVSLTAEPFQAAVDAMKDKGLSRETMAKVRNLASLLCKECMRLRLIEVNFGQLIQLPRQSQENCVRSFTLPELSRIWDRAESGDQDAMAVLVLCYTGMRPGELMGVKIERHIRQKEAWTYIQTGSKTEAGRNRIIPVPAVILPFLDALKGGRDIGPLIATATGQHWRVENWRKRRFYPLMESLKIEDVVPYTCRHTYADLQKRRGIEGEIMMEIMGHADYSTTVEKYHTTTSEDLDRICMAVNGIERPRVTG